MGVVRATARAGDCLVPEEQPTPTTTGLGWSDAILAQLAPAVLGQPVRGPGRRQHRADASCGDSGAAQRDLDLQGDHIYGRTAGVRGRYRHLDASILDTDAPHHAPAGTADAR